jgi:hypothetical protein
MRMVMCGLIGVLVLLACSTTASAQVIGTFAWQTQPYCNVVTVTVVQQGAQYQLTGHDNLCGAGPAPVTGTAVPAGGGVRFGFAVARPDGRAAHLSASIDLGTLSGTWADEAGLGGTFAFGGAGGGALRPAPAVASTPVMQVLTYTGLTNSNGGTISPAVKLRDLGSFTSQGGDLRLHWQSHVTTSGGPGGCNFQLRIDGQASGTVDAQGLVGDEAVLIAETRSDAPATVTTWFRDVAAGAHTIELWVRSVSAFCTDNSGNFKRRVVVEEFGAP